MESQVPNLQGLGSLKSKLFVIKIWWCLEVIVQLERIKPIMKNKLICIFLRHINKHHTKPVFVFENIIEQLLGLFLLNGNNSLAIDSFSASFFGLKSMR